MKRLMIFALGTLGLFMVSSPADACQTMREAGCERRCKRVCYVKMERQCATRVRWKTRCRTYRVNKLKCDRYSWGRTRCYNVPRTRTSCEKVPMRYTSCRNVPVKRCKNRCKFVCGRSRLFNRVRRYSRWNKRRRMVRHMRRCKRLKYRFKRLKRKYRRSGRVHHYMTAKRLKRRFRVCKYRFIQKFGARRFHRMKRRIL